MGHFFSRKSLVESRKLLREKRFFDFLNAPFYLFRGAWDIFSVQSRQSEVESCYGKSVFFDFLNAPFFLFRGEWGIFSMGKCHEIICAPDWE
jgi:hypothetical protein